MRCWEAKMSLSTLAQVIRRCTNELSDRSGAPSTPFPSFDGSKIQNILDETMGYA